MKKIKYFIIALALMFVSFFTLSTTKIYALGEELTEEEETQEEVVQEEGFLEKYWAYIVSSLLGTTSGVSLLVVLVYKVLGKGKDVLKKTKENAEQNGKDVKKIEELSNQLTEAQKQLVIAYDKIEQFTTYFKENNEKFKEDTKESIADLKHEIATDYGDKVIQMAQSYENIMTILNLIAENSDDIVKNGASRLIKELIEESKKEAANGEREQEN